MMMKKINFQQSILSGLYAGGISAVINAVLFFTFHGVGVISDTIYPKPNEPLTIIPVVVASIIPLLIGSVIFFLLEKFTDQGLRIFNIVTITLTILSLYSPFGVIPGVTIGYSLVLCVMHIVPALALLYFLRKAKRNSNNSI